VQTLSAPNHVEIRIGAEMRPESGSRAQARVLTIVTSVIALTIERLILDPLGRWSPLHTISS
jgi:hypothetical protein